MRPCSTPNRLEQPMNFVIGLLASMTAAAVVHRLGDGFRVTGVPRPIGTILAFVVVGGLAIYGLHVVELVRQSEPSQQDVWLAAWQASVADLTGAAAHVTSALRSVPGLR